MLNSLIQHYTDGNKAQFAELLGVKPQTISAWISRNTFDTELIYSKCEGVSADWLMAGEGEMLRDQSCTVGRDSMYETHIVDENPFLTYLLPISSRGGSLTGFAAQGVTLDNCEQIISPIANVDFAISIYGDSMAPEYPSGSQVLIKKIDPTLFIEWGKVYVLDTPNGVVLKEIHECKGREGFITCHSVNPDPKFADYDVPLSEVYGMYRVLMCLSFK